MWYIHSYSKRLFRCHWLRINVTEKFEQMWHGYAVYVVAVSIESIKTTSLENVTSTWKNKEHYLRSKDKAEKWYDVSRHMQLHMSKYKIYEDILSIMSNLQPNCCGFPKGGPTCRKQVVTPRHQTPQGTISCKAWNSPAEYPSWVARCDIKGSDGTMLNPILWKKVPGQKHSGSWEIVECQIPNIKMLFKTNT